MKISEGYPDAEVALYGNEGYASIKPIDLKVGAAPIRVELRFSPPDAVIEWRVVSKTSNNPIKNVRFRIAWADNPHIYVSSTLPENGILLFVLPKHPVSILISAPGFENWSTVELPAGKLLLQPGTHDKMVILLKPSA